MDLSWVKREAWPDKSTTVGCISCPATSGHCQPPPLDLTDSHWQPPCFTKCWHSECRHLSPLAFVLSHSGVARPFLGCLTSAIWLTVFSGVRGKRTKKGPGMGERENKIEEGVRSAPSPPGGFNLQQQHLEAQLRPWVMPPTDTPIILEPLWCT